jgi:hypothetical protein
LSGSKPSGSMPVGLTNRELGIESQPASTDDKPVDHTAPKCIGCGRYHGGVNALIACLEKTVLSLRSKLGG